MSSEQVDTPKASGGAPEQSLPSHPKKQAKEKPAKTPKGKGPSLEVSLFFLAWRGIPLSQSLTCCSSRSFLNTLNTVSKSSTESRQRMMLKLLVREGRKGVRPLHNTDTCYSQAKRGNHHLFAQWKGGEGNLVGNHTWIDRQGYRKVFVRAHHHFHGRWRALGSHTTPREILQA